jgi:hypothetical protein
MQHCGSRFDWPGFRKMPQSRVHQVVLLCLQHRCPFRVPLKLGLLETNIHFHMATTRLRKTFKYPSESEDSDGSRDELDDEGNTHANIPSFTQNGSTDQHSPEQESLISKLRSSEAEQNAQYNLIFSILPLTVILPFLFYLPSCTPRTALFCLLAVTSLCSSSFIMRYLPMGSPNARGRAREINVEIDGPVEMYLPYLNGGVSGLLLLASWSLKRHTDSQEGLWVFLLLPAIMFAMIMIARKSMADVEAGISQLDSMKYNYKGA